MTNLQDLKDNRNVIIETLTKKFGAENLKSAMSMMADMANDDMGLYGEYDSWEDMVDEIEEMDLFRNHKMKTADYLAALNDHESFDMKAYYANKH